MKPTMSQILLIILAIAFAAALTVIIAILCISYLGNSPSNDSGKTESPTEQRTEEPEESEAPTETQWSPTLPESSAQEPESTGRTPTEESDPQAPDTNTETKPIFSSEEQTEPTEPEPQGNGLTFATNGNGTCTLIGLGACTDVCIVIPERSPAGDRVTSIAPRVFYACSFVTAIQIPSGVSSIGELAFANCANLVYISVNTKNPYYCDIDGILYTADLYTLLAYPPMHSGNSVSIRNSTYRIAEMAFYGCANLTHVYYSGSADQWDRIIIEPKNHSLTAAAKTFDSGKK